MNAVRIRQKLLLATTTATRNIAAERYEQPICSAVHFLQCLSPPHYYVLLTALLGEKKVSEKKEKSSCEEFYEVITFLSESIFQTTPLYLAVRNVWGGRFCIKSFIFFPPHQHHHPLSLSLAVQLTSDKTILKVNFCGRVPRMLFFLINYNNTALLTWTLISCQLVISSINFQGCCISMCIIEMFLGLGYSPYVGENQDVYLRRRHCWRCRTFVACAVLSKWSDKMAHWRCSLKCMPTCF